MKRNILMFSFIVVIGAINNVHAQDTPMTQKPIISSSQDSASTGTQWPAKGQDSLNRPIKKTMDSSLNAKNNRFYYYPSRNIYYNDATRDFIYYDSASTKWSTVKDLPSNMQVDKNTERYPFSYTGTEPWNDNSSHRMKHKVKKDGTVKIKEKEKD